MDQTHRGYDLRVHRGHHVRLFSLHDYRDRGRHGHLFSYGRDHHDRRDHQKYFSL